MTNGVYFPDGSDFAAQQVPAAFTIWSVRPQTHAIALNRILRLAEDLGA